MTSINVRILKQKPRNSSWVSIVVSIKKPAAPCINGSRKRRQARIDVAVHPPGDAAKV
jgi:hypothetical protein